ncbi:hypothetical protein RHOFW104T7_07885 [Rhodanobacter thiooxydans]|uniref:Uncharacterized protein n=3 Tax=Rhodanobacter thiooxydans TaxID=416169 RepID=A0A154QLI0_9GAMM|nr:hypothetical protein RHOFW104T7_07885 [Rhodanobacter thiooxydans]
MLITDKFLVGADSHRHRVLAVDAVAHATQSGERGRDMVVRNTMPLQVLALPFRNPIPTEAG